MTQLFDSIRLLSTAIDSKESTTIESNREQSGNACFAGRCRRLWWLSAAITFSASADIDLSGLQYSTSAASDGRRLELREEGTVGHALVSGTEYKGDPNGASSASWNTASLATGWQTLTSGTNAAAILKLDPSEVAIEGGRLSSSAVWDNSKTHVVRNWVTVPSGVTLTITEGAIVKFCESAGIKVLSGGKVQINGAEGADVFFASIGNDTYGGDTNLRAGDFETNSYEIVTLNGGEWSDNGYWVTPDAQLRGYPEVTIHDSLASVSDGVARVPVTVEGTRNAPFSIDWALEVDSRTGCQPVQDLNALAARSTGTLSWTNSAEGTKFIEIPLKSTYTPNGTETFALSATRARSVNLSNETVRVSVYSGHIAVGDVIENGESTSSAGTEIETRGIGGTMIAKALENITYSPRWSGAASCEVAVDGNRLLSTAIDSGTLAWPRPETPGLYTFTHKAGGETLTARFAVLGDDTTAIDSNRLQSNATWTADKTWLVTGQLTIASGVTLTIEPGAVVKFMPGAKLIVEVGGTCIAKGVKFTHAYDDAVGGDTLFDGAATLPVMEDYEIKGTVTDDDSTEYRYTAPIVLSGTITANTTWRGWKVYNVTGNLTIQNGVTLTVEPGAVVKFNSGVSLTVNSGATLNAIGTRAQPIVFTSIKDDGFGGDTNGDGEKTYPQPGDWKKIAVYGIANMDYCKVLYGAAGTGTDDIILVSGSSASVTFNNGLLAHGSMYAIGVESGHFYMVNSVVTDFYCVFRHWPYDPIVNCVIYDCTRLSNNNGQKFYNCVIQGIVEAWDWSSGSGNTYSHCLFWNEPGFGLQSLPGSASSSNGNIWGDPKFVDAENGDFRIQKGSPCVNAGDAANAPEFDYYGQPRDDGAPDIGICELAGGMSVNDLAAVAVSAQAARSTVGDTLTISYSVANVGKQAVNGSWRDKVSLVSADGGYSIDLGTVVQSAVIAVGATNTFNASYKIPTDSEGTWHIAVGVNIERDIYEGKYTLNNTATSEGTLTVSLPDREAADGFSGTAMKGAPAAAKFALSGAEPMVARINAPAGTVVYLGNGFMPSTSSYSARAVVGADGGLIGIPAGVTSAYILVETTSSKGVSFTMTLESAALAVQSVTPSTLPYTGTTGLIIDGANFAEGCTVVVERAVGASGTGEPPVLLSTVVSPTRMTAQVDCSRLTAGATYSVKVIAADDATATLPNAVTVAKVPAAPKLKATLDAPASVRRGRTLTVYVDYENIGNADMPAPMFELISQGQVFKIDGASYTNSVKVMGLSAEAPVGTLRPGEQQRLGIPVTILAANVKWKLRSYHAGQASAKTTRFSLRELYDEDWVLYHVADDDTTIASLRTAIGSTFADYYTSLGAWLGTVEPQTKDYEVLKSAFGRYQYLKASGMLDAEEEDSPAEGAEGGRLSSAAASASAGRGVLTAPKGGCNHKRLAKDWKDAGNGSIFILCPECKQWRQLVDNVTVDGSGDWRDWYSILESGAFNANMATYVICHGNKNSIDEDDWILKMGKAIMERYPDSADVMVLAVNWGEGANRGVVYRSAGAIPEVADEAARQLAKIGVVPGNTMLIGHSHGGHVAANIVCHYSDYSGSNEKFKRLVGLDVSTTDNFIHKLWRKSNDIVPDLNKWYGSWTPDKWISDINEKCIQSEFYKSSWDMSLEEKGELFGRYNFALLRKGDFYEYEDAGFLPEMRSRHSYSHQWFVKTIEMPDVYPCLGYNFVDDKSWGALCVNSGIGDICNPGPKSVLAGVLRMNRMEFASFVKTENNRFDWRYAETLLKDERKKPMRQLFANSARTIEFEIQSVSMTSKDSLLSGKPVTLTIKNNADNLSIPYSSPAASADATAWPWRNRLGVGIWMVDLDGLLEENVTARGIENWSVVSLDELRGMVGNRAYLVRAVSSAGVGAPNEDSGMPFILPTQTGSVKLETRFDNNLFGEARPLVSRDDFGAINFRKVLLVAVAGVDSPVFEDVDILPSTYKWDIYPDNNATIRQVTAIPANAVAIISKAASNRKASSLKSARLLSAAPTHQLSANALKPGEVVQVEADKNGNWSIALDCTESYTTTDEDEIVFNRFELTDAGNENGAPRFQNNNTICDVERVTVSGTLPQTTDADGNLVCEGKRYTVQLTVASGDNEDDVTTCVIDVRATPDEDDGEEEDSDSSNEPKSCDPNAMEGEVGIGDARYVKPGQELTYTIYFENKSGADAAAACVEVVNPLNEWLDWSSLVMLDVGYNNNVDNGLSGLHEGWSEKSLEGTNTSVKTEFAVNEETGVAEWYLRVIDPNGDSEGWPLDMTGGFLPPNDSKTHCGEGYIRYKVKVRSDAPGNVVITNSATIIFDHFNDPIETDPAWWNTVAPTSSLITLKPNSTSRGSVSGGGTYKIGATATLKAAAKSGYAFAGWFTDKACTKPLNPKGYDNRSPTVKVVVPEDDTTIYAKFVSKGDDKSALKFTSATKKLATTPAKATAGSKFSLKIGASSLSIPTFSATGLPKGLSINKATGEISGVGTVPGAYTAKVTITSAAGNKITQNVKITVNAPSWSKGSFYGTAKPGKKGDPMAYLQFTVGTTGKVSGKVKYKGKAYSFTSTLSSCTASKATFTPKVKIGKKTFKPGTVTVKTRKIGGLSLVEAANSKGTFAAQKKSNLVKKGKALAKLVGKSFTFTKKTKNSGLTKSGDKLKVKLADGDKVTASGTVNGKKLSSLSAPLIVSKVSALPGMTTYTLYADILDAKAKYYKTVVFTVKAPVVLKPVPKVSAAFAK